MNDTAPRSAGALAPAPLDTSHDPLAFGTHISPALRVMLDDRLFDRAKQISGYMAKAEGMIPKHLIGKSEACFAVVMRSLTWGLDPYAVAVCTYQTPGGSVGFEGKLVQAILENSGKLDGPVRYDHYGTATYKLDNGETVTVKTIDTDVIEELKQNGAKLQSRKDWSHLAGKFEIKTGSSGKPYPAPTWNRKDAEGLGVLVRAKVRGEMEERTWPFDLIQAFPLNSTLWATDPKSQICYTACRRFANLAAPGLFMGVPFDREDMGTGMIDVTPAPPTRDQFRPAPQDQPRQGARGQPMTDVPDEPGMEGDGPAWEIVTVDGQLVRYDTPEAAAEAFGEVLSEAASRGEMSLEGSWETNAAFMAALREAGLNEAADRLNRIYGATLEDLRQTRIRAEQAKEAERKRLVAEEEDRKPKPTQEAKPQDGPSAPAQAAQGGAAPAPSQHAPAGEAPQAAPATPPRQVQKPKLPKSPKRPTDYPAFVEDLLAAIRADDGNGVSVYNHFAAEIAFCAENRTADHDRIMAAMDDKRTGAKLGT